ncbi:glycosyltransferase involved in cell wall biosynthesis [Marivita geojedonensis]|nr:glycosyltransferase involved in cell wall biosynthesis [Marivita geojedonensis]
MHVTPYLDASAGGPPVVVERLSEHAAENGFSAQILTTAKMTSDRGEALRATCPGAIVLPNQLAATFGAASRQVAKAVSAADILHCHTMWSPLVASAVRQAKRAGVPYVVSPHGMLDPYSIGQKPWKKRLYLAVIEGRTIRGASQLLFTAEEERRLANPITGETSSAIIPLGADAPPDRTETLRQEFLSQHPELRNRKRAIFLGRLHAKKRPQTALRSMIKVLQSEPSACLLFVGSGEAEGELRQLVAQLKLEESVRFLGFLAGREKWQAMAASDVFLLPSQQENFAIALAEALHAGVPALITRKVNIWREISRVGAGQVLEEEDLEVSLSAGMLRYFHNHEVQQRASEAAHALAHGSFDWRISARLTHGLYDEILSV